eukprot:5799088-Prymnesium_polylepis.1
MATAEGMPLSSLSPHSQWHTQIHFEHRHRRRQFAALVWGERLRGEGGTAALDADVGNAPSAGRIRRHVRTLMQLTNGTCPSEASHVAPDCPFRKAAERAITKGRAPAGG